MSHKKVTVQEFADVLNISRQAAYRAITRCGIPLEDGLLDLAAGTALYRSRTRQRVKARPAAAPQGAGAGDADPQAYEVSRAQREAAEARIAELTLGTMSGTLFERQAVERAVFEAARGLRDQLSSCAGTLGATVAGLTSAQECEAEIRREHRYLLETFTRELDQKVESL